MAEETQWKEITGELFKFDKPGDSLEGILVSREKTEGAGMKENILYRVDCGNARVVSFFGSAMLNGRLSAVGIGEEVRIKYEADGEAKKGRHPMKIFKVWVKG